MKAFKYILLCIIVAGLGLIPAYIFHKYEVLTIDERFYWEQWKQTDEGKTGPKLFTAANTVIDFGAIDPTQDYSRELILENVGDHILEVWVEPNPDSVVKVDLTEEKIEIFGHSSYPIMISLEGKEVTGDVSETITIKSNDVRPNEGTLEIKVTGSLSK